MRSLGVVTISGLLLPYGTAGCGPRTRVEHLAPDVLLDMLFSTPACRAQYVVPLPDEVLTAWPDGSHCTSEPRRAACGPCR